MIEFTDVINREREEYENSVEDTLNYNFEGVSSQAENLLHFELEDWNTLATVSVEDFDNEINTKFSQMDEITLKRPRLSTKSLLN